MPWRVFCPDNLEWEVIEGTSIASPLPQIEICPTGGVTLAKITNYLALPNVLCVGGSLVTPGGLIENEYWSEIPKLAEEVSQLQR